MTDKILIDRSVVEQALWTLEDVFGKHKVDVGAINALRAALEQPQFQSGGIPPNWKLVPVEPNMSMTQSALNASRRWVESDAPLPRGQELWAAEVCWSAMLAAAPQPQAEQTQDVDWTEVGRLLKTVKYLIGIAERGAGRKMRDDETVEQFVLGYVQSLEQPIEQEPVAWAVMQDGAICWEADYPFSNEPGWCDSDQQSVPLYTHPQPPRQPLTDEEIVDIGNETHRAMPDDADGQEELLEIARAIERAHGIGGEE